MLNRLYIILLIFLSLFTVHCNYKNDDFSSKNKEFLDNKDETISELVTDLMWQRADDGETRTWEEAEGYCSNFSLADYHDWRLPDKDELSRLIIREKNQSPTIDPLFICRRGTYWTGSKAKIARAAWIVDFRYGQLQVYHTDYPRYYVRCVRNSEH